MEDWKILGIVISVLFLLLYGVISKKWNEIGAGLLVLALIFCYAGWINYADIRDAKEYEDIGIISLVPYQVLPESVGNYGRNRRLYPTRTAYMVYYKATNGSIYRYKEEVATKSIGEDIVVAGVEIERRVLRIPAESNYVLVLPEQTAESYTAQLRRNYILVMGAGVVYIVGYGIVLVMLQKRKQNNV